jgi:hypothetical protein
MTKKVVPSINKTEELAKYRDLVLATLDYYIENRIMEIKTPDFDPTLHFQSLKTQTKEHFEKGRLSKLKLWFHDLSEMQIETRDLNFNSYLRNKTGLNINIFQDYYERINKIIEKGKIMTEGQFNDVKNMVDHLCQADPVDHQQIDILNKLVVDYEQKKSSR